MLGFNSEELLLTSKIRHSARGNDGVFRSSLWGSLKNKVNLQHRRPFQALCARPKPRVYDRGEQSADRIYIAAPVCSVPIPLVTFHFAESRGSFMKTFLIVVLTVIVGAFAVAGIGYAGMQVWPRWAAEYGPEIAVDAASRLRQAEARLAQAKDEYERWVALGDVAFWKSAEANAEPAAALARELLAMAEKDQYQKDWNYGNAIHKAHSALGRIALRKDDKAGARNHLIASATSKGSPQMNTFGPNMGFAKEMLEAGEKEAVLEYFRLCRAFWEMGQDQLDVWERMVREGKSPRFGANMLY
jgi:hypothetical protein